MKLSLILITAVPDIAKSCIQAGVDRIMVDFEMIGKKERQGHRDTLISAHTLDDLRGVAAVVDPARLIVRTNDLHDDIGGEIDAVLASAPGFVMLPMVRSPRQVREYAARVDGRAKLITLVETRQGIENIKEIASMPEVDEVYIGLNDLHLDLGLRFMFEPLASGMIDTATAAIDGAGKPFGFGGVARMHEGLVPGRVVLAEHVRLGSSSVILSRTFHRRMAEDPALAGDEEFIQQIGALRSEEERLQELPKAALNQYHEELVTLTKGIGRGA